MEMTLGGLAVVGLVLLWAWYRRSRVLRIRLTRTVTASGGGVITGYRKDSPVYMTGRIHSLRHMSPALGKRAIRRANANRRFSA